MIGEHGLPVVGDRGNVGQPSGRRLIPAARNRVSWRNSVSSYLTNWLLTCARLS